MSRSGNPQCPFLVESALCRFPFLVELTKRAPIPARPQWEGPWGRKTFQKIDSKSTFSENDSKNRRKSSKKVAKIGSRSFAFCPGGRGAVVWQFCPVGGRRRNPLETLQFTGITPNFFAFIKFYYVSITENWIH